MILRSGLVETKESKVAVGDIVPVPGTPVRGDPGIGEPGYAAGDDPGVRPADDGRRGRGALQRGVRGGHPGPGELPQRLPAAGVGHPGRDGRAGDPEAAARAPTSRTLLEHRRRAERALATVVATSYLLGVSTRRVEKLAASLGCRGPVQVAGQRDGGGAGRDGGQLPVPAAGRRPVHVRVDRRADPEGPRGRPHGERALPDRHRRQRRRVPGDPRHRRDQLRGRRGLAGVPARPGRPRPVRRRRWSPATTTPGW